MTSTMKTSHILIALVAITAFSITSCAKKEGCTDPNAINYDAEVELDNGSCVYEYQGPELALHFRSMLGDADFSLHTDALNWEGRKVRFSTAQFYVSGIGLDSVVFPDIYLLVNQMNAHHVIGRLPEGHYNGLRFNLGVDAGANHLDPAVWPSSHALSSNNPEHAHWGWDPGYIFISMVGLVDTTAAKNGQADAPFVIHIGLDELLTPVSVDTHLDLDGDLTLTLNVDWLRFLDGIDMRAQRSTHTTNNMPLALAVAANADAVFSVE